MWTSTLFLSPHSLQILSRALLAPGTQWSQQPSESEPAAWTPLTYGAVIAAAEPRAAVLRTARRDRRDCPIGLLPDGAIIRRFENDTLGPCGRLVTKVYVAINFRFLGVYSLSTPAKPVLMNRPARGLRHLGR